MRGLVTAGGDLVSPEIFKEEYGKVDYKIAVDSGMKFFLKNNCRPDIVIGDFDSISKEGKDFIKENKIPIKEYSAKKDWTDLELGIEYLINKGCQSITILGGTGTRFDHSLANIFMLARYYQKGIQLILRNDFNRIQVTDNLVTIPKKYKYLSILPIFSEGAVVTLQGVAYPAKETKLIFGSTRGVSNEIIEEQATISVLDGLVYIVESNE